MESIILCGGEAKRMKPYLPFNKALAEIKPGITLIEHQIHWLTSLGIDRIILAIDLETHRTLKAKGLTFTDEVECSVEVERLGTGGAILKAVEQVESSFFYVMNVDDLLISETYTPFNLLTILQENPEVQGSVLLSRARFPFGIVETSNSRVTGFRQKPVLDHKVCTGHYAFTKTGVRKYFPLKGNFEDSALQTMADNSVLNSLELEGEWITVNNIKQLEAATQSLQTSNRKRHVYRHWVGYRSTS